MSFFSEGKAEGSEGKDAPAASDHQWVSASGRVFIHLMLAPLIYLVIPCPLALDEVQSRVVECEHILCFKKPEVTRVFTSRAVKEILYMNSMYEGMP